MTMFWQTILSSAVVASIISIIGSKIIESKNNKRNNYANNVIAHKVDELDKFKTLYGKFMSNCSKVNNIDSGDLNGLLKEIETIKFQLQLSIDDSFIEYKEFMIQFDNYADGIQHKVGKPSNEDELKQMVFTYIFFENIWIEKKLHGSKNNVSKIYSKAKKRYNEIFSKKN